ncbi:MAG: ATP-binding cassette domain-containing protein [Clostridia bacterium]|nr:ATP-binding cassette domain-containing protein [Clostridia bacterium]
MIQVRDLTIIQRINGRALTSKLSFTLNDGEKAVIIGEEGNGKSTLLRCIFEPQSIDSYAECSGDFLLNGNRLGYLPQQLPEADAKKSVADYLAFSAETQRRLAGLMEELGLDLDLRFETRPLETLSGGEKVKLQLVRLLLDEPDVLLLDEPTNDIDLQTLMWLEDFLAACPQAVLFVSHDETLIENVADMVIHLEQLHTKKECRHTVAHLPYRAYIDERRSSFKRQEQLARKEKAQFEARMERYQRIFERVQHEQRTISRGNPSGGRLLKKKMHSVKAMGARFEKEKQKMTKLPVMEQPIFLSLPETFIPPAKEVLNLELPELRAGDRLLAKDIRLLVRGGAHIGIFGDNGVGKTTLLRHIERSISASGRFECFYMPQNYLEQLPTGINAVEFLAPSGSKDEVTRARTYLGSLKFTRDEMTSPIGRLSGGQRAKLYFLNMALKERQVLVLDEPTRNFSPLSNPVIRGVLSEFRGAIISVSHDRKYLTEVCDTLYRLTRDGLVLQ